MLGALTQIFTESIFGLNSNGYTVKFIAEAEFDGNKILLTENDLGNVALGYVITCHKALGSQFKRAVIILDETKIADFVDNTWLYTAVTRAERQVVIIGEKAFFIKKLLQLSKVSQRVVGLHFWLVTGSLGSRSKSATYSD